MIQSAKISHQQVRKYNAVLKTMPSNNVGMLTIHFSTLKSHIHAKAAEIAFAQLFEGRINKKFEHQLDKETKRILNSKTIFASEFIKRDGRGRVFVCLDHNVVDSNFVHVALDVIEQYNIKPEQVILLGRPKTYTSDEITFLTKH